jgi:hypothetical protein
VLLLSTTTVLTAGGEQHAPVPLRSSEPDVPLERGGAGESCVMTALARPRRGDGVAFVCCLLFTAPAGELRSPRETLVNPPRPPVLDTSASTGRSPYAGFRAIRGGLRRTGAVSIV